MREATSDWDLNRFIITPQMKLSLANLSGVTEFNPHLLEYICQIETRVRIVAPTKVSAQLTYPEGKESSKFQGTDHRMDSENMRNLAIRKILMQSKPLVAFEFNSMKMIVDSPAVTSPRYNA
ncbi:hypothetical protein ABFS83_11G077600 [Erythranthe nasuta]